MINYNENNNSKKYSKYYKVENGVLELKYLLQNNLLDILNEAASNNHITRINFHSSSIKDKDVKAVAKFLEKNNTVKKLSLGYNDITDEGVKCLAESLKVNKTVEELYIKENLIGSDGVKYLIDMLKVNINITLLNGIDFADNSSQGLMYSYLFANEHYKQTKNIIKNKNKIGVKAQKELYVIKEIFQIIKEVDSYTTFEILKKRSEFLDILKNSNEPHYDEFKSAKEQFLQRSIDNGVNYVKKVALTAEKKFDTFYNNKFSNDALLEKMSPKSTNNKFMSINKNLKNEILEFLTIEDKVGITMKHNHFDTHEVNVSGNDTMIKYNYDSNI